MPNSAFPTETEIYILPTGEVVVADLPAELATMTQQLGAILSAEPEAALEAQSTRAPSETSALDSANPLNN